MSQILYEVVHIVVDKAFLFQLLCVAFVTVISLDNCKKCWKDVCYLALKIIILTFVFAVINFVFFIFSKYSLFFAGIGFWFSYLGGIVLYSIFFCNYNRNPKIVMVSAVFSMAIIVGELGSTCGHILEYIFDGFNSMYCKIVADLLILFIAVIIKRNSISKYEVSAFAAFLNLVACALSTVTVIIYDLFSIHLFRRTGNDLIYVNYLITIILLFLYIINVINYLMTYSLTREQHHVLKLQNEAQLSKSASQLLEISDYNINELAKISHDLDNQFAYMKVLLQQNNYIELHRYFDEMLQTFSTPLIPYINCGNRVLNAILNLENIKAHNNQIELDCKVAVPPELPFSELDLCNLITNIVDNAIESCQREQTRNPIVHVSVGIRGDYMFLSVTNPTSKTIEDALNTSKQDKVRHGKGMSIIKGIIKRYHGHYNYTIRNGTFCVECILDVCSIGEESMNG